MTTFAQPRTARPRRPVRHVAPFADPPTAVLAGDEAARLRAPDPAPPPPERRRDLGSRTADDVLAAIGSLIGSLALVWTLFQHVLPFTGTFGFVVAWWLAFLGLYALVSAQRHGRIAVVDRVATVIASTGALVVGGALVTVIAFTFAEGWDALGHLGPLLFTDATVVGPRTPLGTGGIGHAIVGTLVEIAIAVAITLPLGVGCAVYLTEVRGRLSRVVRTVVEAMTALPSIVAGLFVYTVLLITLGLPRSGFAGAVAISVMMLPIVTRSAEVVLRVVPGGLREASLALGASQWQTVWRVVLPTARPGLATALILGVARGVGETSPVLLTSLATDYFYVNPFGNAMNSLPLLAYTYARSGEPLLIARAFGAASVLLALVLTLFVITRFLARQRVGRR